MPIPKKEPANSEFDSESDSKALGFPQTWLCNLCGT